MVPLLGHGLIHFRDITSSHPSWHILPGTLGPLSSEDLDSAGTATHDLEGCRHATFTPAQTKPDDLRNGTKSDMAAAVLTQKHVLVQCGVD